LLTVPNHILQGQWRLAGESSASFLINSTIGILGFNNPAQKMGLKNQQEDIGQTLGAYGFSGGCYFVLPVLGPTTVRDSIGMIADSFVDPFAHVTLREKELFSISGNDVDYFSVKGATAVDFRADNMTNLDSLEKNSIDMYAALKSLYLQSREKKIGNTFSSEDDDDWSEFNK
jgi:phospholipid-binding lipoprotein MlaA